MSAAVAVKLTATASAPAGTGMREDLHSAGVARVGEPCRRGERLELGRRCRTRGGHERTLEIDEHMAGRVGVHAQLSVGRRVGSRPSRRGRPGGVVDARHVAPRTIARVGGEEPGGAGLVAVRLTATAVAPGGTSSASSTVSVPPAASRPGASVRVSTHPLRGQRHVFAPYPERLRERRVAADVGRDGDVVGEHLGHQLRAPPVARRGPDACRRSTGTDPFPSPSASPTCRSRRVRRRSVAAPGSSCPAVRDGCRGA